MTMTSEQDLGEVTLRYWQASLAWKNRGDWAKGWTQGTFIAEVRDICRSPHQVGWHADDLLDDVIYDKEHKPLGSMGELVRLVARPKSLVNG